MRLDWVFEVYESEETTPNPPCEELNTSAESLFFAGVLAKFFVYLEVSYTLLVPALDPMSERAYDFQYNFIKNEEAVVVLDMLTEGKFCMMNIDESTKRSAYHDIKALQIVTNDCW
ncbi:probable ubiquitin carboxyl-terminal hydrolase FAF-X [Venturia canescens]|uniref:probable ubiquitin carboxyl-terminal hydrolase FAF-X n=1 Tax=Venturia canescens TaxID=32260 RepID=UPI001C9D32F6|nr:probable ubiquitin carboxyl-terminal hydrolase FAF-X [Venturia canescens]